MRREESALERLVPAIAIPGQEGIERFDEGAGAQAGRPGARRVDLQKVSERRSARTPSGKARAVAPRDSTATS